MLLENYTLTKLLGKGSFGDVYLTTKKNSNLSYATKRMDRDLAEHPKYCKYFVNEVSILRNIYHKNIVKIEDLKKTKNHYYIIMEYCNGGSLYNNLEKYITKYEKPFPEQVVQHLMRQIVSALNYLHGLKIVHRDLKLDNILVNYYSEEDKKNINLLNADIKLVDFGFATHISNVSLLTTAIGSPFNMDPRILKKFNSHAKCPQTYDEKADIWSLGILCYQMLMGEYAFIGNSLQEISSKIEKGTFKVPINFAKETITFLSEMLQYDCEKRSTAAELSKHPFLTKYIDDFSYINLKNVSNKNNYRDLYINIKDSKNFGSIVNKEGVKLFNIDSTDLFSKEKGEKTINTKNPDTKTVQTGVIGKSMNITNQRDNIANNLPINKQEVINSTPLPNSSKSNKDPVINQLLNIEIPQKEKSLLNSLIFTNENKTQIIKSPLKIINEGKALDKNTFGFSYQNQLNEIEQKMSKTSLFPSNKSQLNPLNNLQVKNNQITPKKMEQNQLNNSQNSQNSQNTQNLNQINYNQINRTAIDGPRALSSQNLAYLQIQNSDGKYNTMISKGIPIDFTFGINNGYDPQKMNFSDSKLHNMNVNNINNNYYTGYKIQPFSSKNLDFRNININDTFNQNIGQNQNYK